jgi:uncharacterized protein (TIGR02588 family)
MRRNWLEWVVLAVSVAAIVGVAGFLVVDGLTDEGRPPDPVVRLDPGGGSAASSAWLVPATITNAGDRAAEMVELVATATVAGTDEEATVTIDYLPAGSEVEVTFGFSAEPDGEVEVRVAGFRSP